RPRKQSAGGIDLVVRQALCLARVKPETAGDEQKDERAEEEATLPLQARLAKQTLEGSVGHTPLQIADCGLQNSNCNPQSAICNLPWLAFRTVMTRPPREADTRNWLAAAGTRLARATVDPKFFLVSTLQSRTADVIADRRASPLDRTVQYGHD